MRIPTPAIPSRLLSSLPSTSSFTNGDAALFAEDVTTAETGEPLEVVALLSNGPAVPISVVDASGQTGAAEAFEAATA
ncbi:hypothetical protein [Kribbella swartbergensis]